MTIACLRICNCGHLDIREILYNNSNLFLQISKKRLNNDIKQKKKSFKIFISIRNILKIIEISKDSFIPIRIVTKISNQNFIQNINNTKIFFEKFNFILHDNIFYDQ